MNLKAHALKKSVSGLAVEPGTVSRRRELQAGSKCQQKRVEKLSEGAQMTSNQRKEYWGARKYESTTDQNTDAVVLFTSSSEPGHMTLDKPFQLNSNLSNAHLY